jgi:hypothetical protein
VTLTTFADPARAQQSESLAPADKLVNLRLEWHTQQARQEAAGWELELLAPPRPGGSSVGRFQDPHLVLNQLRPELITDYETLRNAALKLAKAAETRREEAQKEWVEVYRQRIAFRQYADQQQDAYKFDFDTGTQPAFQPTLFDAALVVWAVFVFLVALQLGWHVRRVALRKARRAAALVLLPLLAVSGCSSGPVPDGRPWTVREEATLTAETKEFTEKAAAAMGTADRKWAAAVNGWAALVAVPGTSGETVEKILRDGERTVHERLRAAAVDARLAARLAKEAEDERTQLAADKTKLAELTSAAKLRTILYTVGRCAAVGVLFGVAVAPFWRARRKEAAQVKSDAKKCPRCFSERLFVEKHASPLSLDDDAAPRSRYRGPKGKSKPKESTDEGPKETGYVECKACGFRFLRSYQKVHRLCFPVVGVRSSGKTHMLATGYDRVRKRTAPSAAVVQPAPSLGDARFEQYIDLIMNLKRDAGATVHGEHALPDPVMLHVRDIDPAGPNTALVNLFDYAGEMLNNTIDRDRL